MDVQSLVYAGENEVWSYGNATQVVLEKFVRVRNALKPYIAELAVNVSARGVPTMRPLWWNFPEDEHAMVTYIRQSQTRHMPHGYDCIRIR